MIRNYCGFRRYFCIVAAAVVLAPFVWADSAMVGYQGTLRLTGGAPVADGNYALKFSIWDSASGGVKLWEESQPVVAVKDGLFSVQLGATVSLGTLFNNNASVWLEVAADTGSGLETYTPRVAMAGVPYAQQANNAGTVGGVSASGLAAQMDSKDSAHNSSGSAHSDIRTQIGTDIGTHNSSGSAHAALQVPAGVIVPYAGATAPAGWLLCNGASAATATYPALFAVVGYAYGGSGASFNLPNLTGRVPVGRDGAQAEFTTLGQTGGAKTHTLSIAEMPSHSHPLNQSGYNGTGNQSAVGQNPVAYANNSNTNTVGGGGAHNNLQPYIVLNYIIKY